MRLFSRRKKYYWYAIKYLYRHPRTGEVLFHWYTEIGLQDRSTILDGRQVKKIPIPLHKRKDVSKRQLINGNIEYQVKCYLGRFPENKSEKYYEK